MGVRTPNSEARLKTACYLAFQRHALADIYMSMQSVPEIRRNRRGLAIRPLRQPRRGSADLRLLGGPPGRLIGQPDIPTTQAEQISGCGFPRAEAGT
jgi:hypothetical protein